jgi:tetratricopeptide (TPR) repeat protein
MLTIQKNYARAESLYSAIVDRDSTSRLALMVLNEMGKMRFGQAADAAKLDKAAAASLYAQTIDIFERRISLDPGNDEAYYYVGLCQRELGRYPEAIAAMRQSANLADGKVDRHFWLGLFYVQADSIDQAQQEFRRVVELDTGNSNNKAIALRQLGYYRLLRKEYVEAIEFLERSASINPNDAGTLLWLAQAYQNSGNRGRAVEYYRRVLKVDPGNADARNGLKILEGGAR